MTLESRSLAKYSQIRHFRRLYPSLELICLNVNLWQNVVEFAIFAEFATSLVPFS